MGLPRPSGGRPTLASTLLARAQAGDGDDVIKVEGNGNNIQGCEGNDWIDFNGPLEGQCVWGERVCSGGPFEGQCIAGEPCGDNIIHAGYDVAWKCCLSTMSSPGTRSDTILSDTITCIGMSCDHVYGPARMNEVQFTDLNANQSFLNDMNFIHCEPFEADSEDGSTGRATGKGSTPLVVGLIVGAGVLVLAVAVVVRKRHASALTPDEVPQLAVEAQVEAESSA